MARLTQSEADIRHLFKISKKIQVYGIIEITTKDETVFEGVVRGIKVGNNGGKGGLKYYGEIEIETISKKIITIDYLDIKDTKDVWSSRSTAYKDKGIINYSL